MSDTKATLCLHVHTRANVCGHSLWTLYKHIYCYNGQGKYQTLLENFVAVNFRLRHNHPWDVLGQVIPLFGEYFGQEVFQRLHILEHWSMRTPL